ncbi:hypothetical protein GCM10010389_40710 [Streptomyces echinoruber]|uniref:Uncharacterized protein n=1 Tax=Streptomyces echinoruber TaxID=68898 RepID=A0A918RFW0_9ACTN|nr:hypothetical protein GCM10010389_40710 [Streptomyces echinoruber]
MAALDQSVRDEEDQWPGRGVDLPGRQVRQAEPEKGAVFALAVLGAGATAGGLLLFSLRPRSGIGRARPGPGPPTC